MRECQLAAMLDKGRIKINGLREWRSQALISFEITMRMRCRIVRYLATKLVGVETTDMDE